jgi:hypothetical protein
VVVEERGWFDDVVVDADQDEVFDVRHEQSLNLSRFCGAQ